MGELVDGVGVDSVDPRNLYLRDTLSEQNADSSHVIYEQLPAVRSVGRVSPVLGEHIPHVVGTGPNEQMVWPHARPVVAPVADVSTGRDGAVVQDVGEAVGKHLPVCRDSECPVTVPDTTCYPKPASLGFLDLRPEPR